jgi:hypothetical protein
MKITRRAALVMGIVAACLIATALVITKRAEAAAILKSKSNISNNRSLPIGDLRSTAADVIVLCQSCAYPPMPEEGCLILMDSQTGDIYAYCDEAMMGRAKPLRIGKFTAVGQPIIANDAK